MKNVASLADHAMRDPQAYRDPAEEAERPLAPLGAHHRPLEVRRVVRQRRPDKEPDDEEASRLDGELLDLEPLLRDTVVLDLPYTPLCRPDCAGLCPDCGADLNADLDHSHGEKIDPRWADLTGWTVADEEADEA